MQLRKAAPADLEAVCNMFRRATRAMNENGMYQWTEEYPNEQNLRGDIERGEMYVGVMDGELVCAVVLNHEGEGYERIAWQFHGEDVVIHRLCVAPDRQGQSIGERAMRLVEEQARRLGYGVIRLDTFLHNQAALRLYDKLGYRRRGRLKWKDGDFVYFEKQI